MLVGATGIQFPAIGNHPHDHTYVHQTNWEHDLSHGSQFLIQSLPSCPSGSEDWGHGSNVHRCQ